MMGVDALLNEVEEKRKKALEALDSEYASKREEVKKRTDEQIGFVRESAKRDAAALAQKETTRIQGAAKLQAKKLIFDGTEKLLENNISALRDVLRNDASGPEYRALLRKMAHYASRRLGGKISVICRDGDAASLRAADAKIISHDLHSIGGFKAVSKDGTLELDLTFEEILRGREDDIRASILGKE